MTKRKKKQSQSSYADVYIGMRRSGMFYKCTKPTGSEHKTKDDLWISGDLLRQPECHSAFPQSRINVW